MKKLFLSTIAILLVSVPSIAQRRTAYNVRSGTSLPAICRKSTTSVDVFITTGDDKFYICEGSNSWKEIGGGSGGTVCSEYIANISQAGEAAPTVNSLIKNTFSGTPVWARVGPGQYTLTLAAAFTVKTGVNGNNGYAGAGYRSYLSGQRTSDNVVTVGVYNSAFDDSNDDYINNATIHVTTCP